MKTTLSDLDIRLSIFLFKLETDHQLWAMLSRVVTKQTIAATNSGYRDPGAGQPSAHWPKLKVLPVLYQLPLGSHPRPKPGNGMTLTH